MNLEESIARSSQLQHESNEAGSAFLRTEIDVSLTFVRLALEAGDDLEKKGRNQANARKGYDTLVHLRGRFPPFNEADEQLFKQKLQDLRAALERLGEEL